LFAFSHKGVFSPKDTDPSAERLYSSPSVKSGNFVCAFVPKEIVAQTNNIYIKGFLIAVAKIIIKYEKNVVF
jgi:hypothetical protein